MYKYLDTIMTIISKQTGKQNLTSESNGSIEGSDASIHWQYYFKLKFDSNGDVYDSSQLFCMEFDSWGLKTCQHSIQKHILNYPQSFRLL